MKKLSLIIFCILFMLSLVSCSNSNENNESNVDKKQVDINFEFNNEKSIDSKVCVNTTLPPSTLLDVDIFVGDKYHSTERVEVKSDIEGNYFITESQKDDTGNPIEDGRYILKVELVNPKEQPSSVRNIIGENGELMNGADIYTKDDIKTAKFSRPIEKKDNNFSMPDQ